jgi:membrane-associated phospholipid phosphatase
MNKLLSSLLITLMPIAVFAGGGPLGIDTIQTKDETGIYSRNNQLALEYGSLLVVVGGAVIEGNDTRLGKTFWKAADAMVIADVAAQAGKLVFRRERPSTSNDPNAWFKSSRDKSFPSGEVTHITAIVTPFIAEYAKDTPAVWALAFLPVYDGVARMKSQAHWQTDVLASMALGVGVGLYAGNRSQSWLVNVLPGGFSVGYRKSF